MLKNHGDLEAAKILELEEHLANKPVDTETLHFFDLETHLAIGAG